MSDITPHDEQLLHRTIERFWETIPPLWHQVRGHLHYHGHGRAWCHVEQFHILRHIRKGRQLVSELAEVKQISRPAISQTVDLLVGKGLIERRQSTDDRRFVQLALSPSGSELLNDIFQQNRAWMGGKLACLTPAELATVLAALDGLQKAFLEPAPQASPRTPGRHPG